jgi:hypothetical protein
MFLLSSARMNLPSAPCVRLRIPGPRPAPSASHFCPKSAAPKANPLPSPTCPPPPPSIDRPRPLAASWNFTLIPRSIPPLLSSPRSIPLSSSVRPRCRRLSSLARLPHYRRNPSAVLHPHHNLTVSRAVSPHHVLKPSPGPSPIRSRRRKQTPIRPSLRCQRRLRSEAAADTDIVAGSWASGFPVAAFHVILQGASSLCFEPPSSPLTRTLSLDKQRSYNIGNIDQVPLLVHCISTLPHLLPIQPIATGENF